DGVRNGARAARGSAGFREDRPRVRGRRALLRHLVRAGGADARSVCVLRHHIGFAAAAMPPPLANLPDEALLALIARSDDDALANLYDRYGGVAPRPRPRPLPAAGPPRDGRPAASPPPPAT